jgi:hypothetical protein
MSPTIGCDPELFLFDNLLQRIVPAINKIGGSKHKPLVLKSGGMVQLDGTVLEFGTKPVLAVGTNFSDAIQQSIDEIRTKLYNRFHGRYDLRCGAFAGYHDDECQNLGSALDVGCSPQFRFTSDLSVTAMEGVSQLSPKAIPIGGHIHFGLDCNLEITDPRLIRSVYRHSRYIGLLYHSRSDSDYDRQEAMLMGGPNPAFRIKTYGYELRNLSSLWLADRTIPDLIANRHTNVCQALKSGGGIDGAMPLFKAKMKALATLSNKQHTKYQGTLPLDF